MKEEAPSPCIRVLAGTNGAGKSSIAGAALRKNGGDYFNPDESTLLIRKQNPGLSQKEANIAAWQAGRRLLEKAIDERLDYLFETTLGGQTMTGLLAKALDEKLEVRIWYAGLQGSELHRSRVIARVARGGHDIPVAAIRHRYDSSRKNLILLLPRLTELLVFDNSEEVELASGVAPRPRLVLHLEKGKIIGPEDLHDTPEWAKPIVAAALKL